MDNCKGLRVDIAIKLVKRIETNEYVDASQYQSVIGSLLYLSMKTRPDFTFAVGLAAPISSNLTSQHLTALKRIFQCLRKTTNYGLLFRKRNSK
uniref:Reverse transcriptase Ty1/copia-type domain-containing protein n=1 Tax=Amphimedon queenslandica TaxID=400682 RepID=A0A1X7TFS6_AMPQE